MAKGNLSLAPDEIFAEVADSNDQPGFLAWIVSRIYPVSTSTSTTLDNDWGHIEARYEYTCDLDTGNGETCTFVCNMEHYNNAADVLTPTWSAWADDGLHTPVVAFADVNGISPIAYSGTKLRAWKTDDADTVKVYAMETRQEHGISLGWTARHEHSTDRNYDPDYSVNAYTVWQQLMDNINQLIIESYPQFCIPVIGNEKFNGV